MVLLVLIGALHTGRDTRGPAAVSPSRLGLLLAFGGCAGVNVGSWVTTAMETAGACPALPVTGTAARLARAAGLDVPVQYDMVRCAAESAALTHTAFALTAGLYVSFAVAGLLASRRDVARVAGVLLPLCWIIFGAQLCAALGFAAGGLADALYIRLGLLVYAGRVFVDTSEVAARVRDTGDADVVGHAVNITAGALHMFIRIITVLAEMKGQEEERKREEERRKRS